MRKAKIQKIPIYVDIRAGETVWTPDGIMTAPTTARRYVFLDCENQNGKHLRYEFVAVSDYMNMYCTCECYSCRHCCDTGKTTGLGGEVVYMCEFAGII